MRGKVLCEKKDGMGVRACMHRERELVEGPLGRTLGTHVSVIIPRISLALNRTAVEGADQL